MKMIALDRKPGQPVDVFPDAVLIPDSAITLPGRPLFVPDFAREWEARILVGARVSRLGKGISSRFASRYYDALTLLLRLVPHGDCPGALAAAFDGCIQLGTWIETESLDPAATLTVECSGLTFAITPAELGLDNAIEAVSRYLTIRNGDIIAPAMLPAALPAAVGDIFTATINGSPALKARLK